MGGRICERNGAWCVTSWRHQTTTLSVEFLRLDPLSMYQVCETCENARGFASPSRNGAIKEDYGTADKLSGFTESFWSEENSVTTRICWQATRSQQFFWSGNGTVNIKGGSAQARLVGVAEQGITGCSGMLGCGECPLCRGIYGQSVCQMGTAVGCIPASPQGPRPRAMDREHHERALRMEEKRGRAEQRGAGSGQRCRPGARPLCAAQTRSVPRVVKHVAGVTHVGTVLERRARTEAKTSVAGKFSFVLFLWSFCCLLQTQRYH